MTYLIKEQNWVLKKNNSQHNYTNLGLLEQEQKSKSYIRNIIKQKNDKMGTLIGTLTIELARNKPKNMSFMHALRK